MTSAAVAASQAGATPEVPVPDRPRLVDGVRLHGEMKESAYKDPPFLVERDGAYFPVSRLLHAVLEQADGQSSLADMAEGVSDAIERHVTAENMQVLVANLIQAGLIAGPPGSQQAAAPVAATPSPLTVN